MSKTNTVALTTLVNLYDLLQILFRHVSGKTNDTNLRFHRPTDSKLDEYERVTLDYFEALSKAFSDLAAFSNWMSLRASLDRCASHSLTMSCFDRLE